jgi:hypothetical protein
LFALLVDDDDVVVWYSKMNAIALLTVEITWSLSRVSSNQNMSTMGSTFQSDKSDLISRKRQDINVSGDPGT